MKLWQYKYIESDEPWQMSGFGYTITAEQIIAALSRIEDTESAFAVGDTVYIKYKGEGLVKYRKAIDIRLR